MSRPRARQAPPVPAGAPELPASPVTGTDLCALGRGYGGWPAGSPESRICENAYAR
ncbi:hypothetical protein ACFVXE_09875 [Streptomyces sp. NPDC058231]